MENKNIELYDIYKEVAQNTNFTVEEIKQKMKEYVDFIQSAEEQKFYKDIVPIKGEIPTYEELLTFIIEIIQNK